MGDESGFAPQLSRIVEACELIIRAIDRAEFRSARDISIALDPPASSFWAEVDYTIAQFGKGETGELNQIGTVRETIEAIASCRSVGSDYVISHRSGETCDGFFAVRQHAPTARLRASHARR